MRNTKRQDAWTEQASAPNDFLDRLEKRRVDQTTKTFGGPRSLHHAMHRPEDMLEDSRARNGQFSYKKLDFHQKKGVELPNRMKQEFRVRVGRRQTLQCSSQPRAGVFLVK